MDKNNPGSLQANTPPIPKGYNQRGLFRPILYIFAGISLLLVIGSRLIPPHKFDFRVLLVGNGVLFLATAASLYICGRGLNDKSMHQFTKMLTRAMLMKMGVCLVSVVIWFFIDPHSIEPVSMLSFFVIYFVYTFTEVALLMRLIREKKNG